MYCSIFFAVNFKSHHKYVKPDLFTLFSNVLKVFFNVSNYLTGFLKPSPSAGPWVRVAGPRDACMPGNSGFALGPGMRWVHTLGSAGPGIRTPMLLGSSAGLILLFFCLTCFPLFFLTPGAAGDFFAFRCQYGGFLFDFEQVWKVNNQSKQQ